jgi:hypothetical protein
MAFDLLNFLNLGFQGRITHGSHVRAMVCVYAQPCEPTRRLALARKHIHVKKHKLNK